MDKPEISDRDEMISIFLQLQRTLVLKAIALQPKRELSFGSHIIEVRDPTQVLAYRDFLKNIQRTALVRLASRIHEYFDHSRRLKAYFITLALHLRYMKRQKNPELNYGDYQGWIRRNDSPTAEEIKSWAKSLKALPTIFCLPHSLSDTAAIAKSVQNLQDFDAKWVFYGSSANLTQLADVLSRARLTKSNQNFITQNSFGEDFLKLAGQLDDWIIFQNAPGEIAPNCLKAVCHAYDTKTTLMYGDSDQVDANGVRSHPRFHPDWNLRYAVGENVFAGITIAKKIKCIESILERREVSWLEILSKMIVQAKDTEIVHLPKILFHSKQSLVSDQAEFLKQMSANLDTKYGAHVELNDRHIASIVWPLPSFPKVSILIPTRDRVQLLKKLYTGLKSQTVYPSIEIVIVDNQSSEKSTLAFFKEIRTDIGTKIVSYPHPFNYSAINNFGFQHCTGEILVLLNNDIEVMSSHWLKEAVREALAPEVGVVGAKLYYKNGFVQHAGVVLNSESAGHIQSFERRDSMGYCNRLQFSQELSAVTGACMIMRSEVFARVGGFNEKDLAVAYNDIDLCLRIREMGLKVVWTPKVELYHIESASRPPDSRIEQITRYRHEVEYMRDRWIKVFPRDRFYNPNLAGNKFNFEVSAE